MEDKEEPAVKTRAGFQGKSGLLKKAHGRVLSSYKDRYVSVDKTEVVVYENEDQKNCLERVDLENYDKCLEMKSGFKKKHRLVLIRSPKSANKVQDLKFQAQSAEEKEAWIKALSDAINRAKNKIFDEVKVDESCNLEHVTRTRPKGNRGRRPPTRIHMKEVADVSSDGILRLDLDLENAIMPNGTHTSDVDGTENHKDTTPSPLSSDSTADKALPTISEAEDDNQSQNKVLKPPMPPSKQTTVIEEGTEEEEVPEKKHLKPPMPPSKDVKPSGSPDKTPETSPDSKKKIPPMPPNKPLSSIIIPSDPSTPKTTVHPPTPPSKEKKPNVSVEISHEANENADNEQLDETDEGKDVADGTEVTPPTLPKSPKLLTKQEDRPKSEVLTSIADTEETKSDVPVVVVCLKDSESVNLSPLLGRIEEDKEKKAEEKSVDSGQHSDEDGLEDSVSEDASPTRDSNNDLEALDSKGSKTEISVSLEPQKCSSKGYTSWNLKPPTPLKPTTKARSASSGDLLSNSYGFEGGSGNVCRAVDVKKLETEVALEMEDTNELLNKASRAQTVPRGGRDPEKLLAEAMEKLKKADRVLKEVKKLEPVKDTSRRKSW